MTVHERRMIKEVSWDVLYDDIMNEKSDSKPRSNNSYFFKEKERAKRLYDEIDLEEFLNDKNYSEEIQEPTWEFPKGRRFVHETDQDCALREFEEETSIPVLDTTIIMTKERPMWIKENFCGMNKRMYHNKYILSLIDPNSRGPYIDPTNSGQISEVNDTRWFTYEDARDIIHSFHPEKKEALKKSYKSILRLLNIDTPFVDI